MFQIAKESLFKGIIYWIFFEFTPELKNWTFQVIKKCNRYFTIQESYTRTKTLGKKYNSDNFHVLLGCFIFFFILKNVYKWIIKISFKNYVIFLHIFKMFSEIRLIYKEGSKQCTFFL